MAHEVFISYSSQDKPIADAICAVLEGKGTRCWTAPRDIRPGDDWGGAIVNAISSSRLMVIVFSSHSNGSEQVKREVSQAISKGIIIVPFRIENISPTGAMDYYLSSQHWLDAYTPPLERHIERLSGVVDSILQGESPLPTTPVGPAVRKPVSAGLIDLRRFKVVSILIGRRGKLAQWLFLSSLIILVGGITYAVYALSAGGQLSFSLLGNYATSRSANSIFVAGDTAYIANGGDGLLILDVSTPTSPTKLGQYEMENAKEVVVVDSVAYVVQTRVTKGLQSMPDKVMLIDVSNPSNPTKVGQYDHDAPLWDLGSIEVAGDTMYLTTDENLIMVDVSDRSSPIRVGQYEFGMSNLVSPGLDVVDNTAYVAAGTKGLHIVDVTTPSDSVELGKFDTAGWASRIVVNEDTVYLAEWEEGLEIIDVSSPSSPTKLGQFKPERIDGEEVGIYEVAVGQSVAYVNYGSPMEVEEGIIALDISDPGDPQEIGKYPQLDGVTGLCVCGDLVFITEETYGLKVLEVGYR